MMVYMFLYAYYAHVMFYRRGCQLWLWAFSMLKFERWMSLFIVNWITMTRKYAWHTETLHSGVYTHQQCIPWSSPLEIESATTDCKAGTLPLSHQPTSHTSDAQKNLNVLKVTSILIRKNIVTSRYTPPQGDSKYAFHPRTCIKS